MPRYVNVPERDYTCACPTLSVKERCKQLIHHGWMKPLQVRAPV